MARKKDGGHHASGIENKFEEQGIVDTLRVNYMPYAMSVILSRAIPAIDGFKPAHRKLLYTMYKMGLLTGARTKSTNVVGQTMKLNPHGDASIYETMVRLTRGQDALLLPYVDSKGNFGKHYSRDMAYAASRYTEVKLDGICNELFKNIDKDTVDFVDNYDGSMKEPVMFPTSFPNILVAPNQGIAVSMSSNICSFNLKEVCKATIAYIKNPNCDIKKNLLAPDFSTGAQLVYDPAEIDQIYETGTGGFRLKAKYRYDKKNSLIEIYEIPYSTTIEAIIERIIKNVKENKLKEINDVRNETDLNGLKITIDIKRTADPDKLMAKLYKLTPLSDRFSCNFNILVDGAPQTLGVKGILGEWLKFRTECVKRQTAYDFDKKYAKHHLLAGLKEIMLDIDKAIKIIRDTELDADVIPNLMSGFGIDDVQAEYIAEIKLRNLNKEYLLNRISEMEQLENDMAHLSDILKDDELVKEVIIGDLNDVAKKYGAPRRTEIIHLDEEKETQIATDDFIEDYGIRLFLTKENYFKKITLVSLRSSGEQKLKEDDEIIQELETTNKTDVLLFSSKQNVYKVKAYDLPETKASNMGEYLNNLVDMDSDEYIVYMAATLDYSGYMLFAFENGKVAKVEMSAYATKVNRKKLINAYSDKSPLIGAMFIPEDTDIVLVRDTDKALLFNTSLIGVKATKNTVGVQVFALKKKNSRLTRMLAVTDFVSDEAEKRYRTQQIPSSGHFISDTDKAANNMPSQVNLF
jgi:DNA gyrase subunit A